MYHIKTKVDVPDIEYMKNRVIELMEKGIQLGDVGKLYDKFLGIQEELKELIKDTYNIVNPNSSQQVCTYMEQLDDMEVYEVACINGKWSANKDILSNLSLKGYEFASDILQYRKVKNYVESISSMLNARGTDGRVHPTVVLGKTNRVNYRNPALMNIPKDLLWTVVAPRTTGNKLFSIDIKNQEPSIMINMLNIEELKDSLNDERGLYESLFEKPFKQTTKLNVYNTVKETIRIVSAKEMAQSESIPPVYYTPVKPTVDTVYYNNEKVSLIEVCNTVTNVGVKPLLPATVAVETESGNVYNVEVEWEEIKTKTLSKPGIFTINGTLKGLDIRCEGVARKEFKQAWNAMTYCASIYGVKQMCKHINGEEVYRYFSKIPQFKQYKKNCGDLAARGIQNIRTIFGTLLYADVADPARLQRVLMDLSIQGTGADILSLLVKHFDTEVENRGLKDKLEIYYTRHDELIIEVNGEWLEAVGKEEVVNILRDLLEHQINDWIPFKVEIEEVKPREINIDEVNTDEMFE